MDETRGMQLFGWGLLVAGLAAFVLVARSSQPLVVTNEDCVDVWNATAEPPVDLLDGAPLTVHGEGEQDLGYGLCSLKWNDGDRCRSLGIPVWGDTDEWERTAVRGCQDASIGSRVTLGPEGTLALSPG